jgi:hypothetical protein
MRTVARVPARVLVALALAACGGGEATGPDTGGLSVTVSGLPDGAAASLTVTGPGGFQQSLSGSETVAGLLPGDYTVAAEVVSAGGDLYAGSPASQSVTVSSGATAASNVSYAVASGSLTVTVSGLPGGTDAMVSVSGPGGYAQDLTGTRTLQALLPGDYAVSAQPVASTSTQYSPAPTTQQATVTAGASAEAAVVYGETPSSGLNLRIAGLHFTQSVQTFEGSVPLVAGRDALLRVFVTASESNVASPSVRVRLFQGGTQVDEETITRVGPTPLAAQEGNLNSSWNLVVSRTLVTPTLSIRVDLDPGNSYLETDETDNTFPASGMPLALDVVTATPFRLTLVPVVTASDGRAANLTAANRDQYLETATRLHPLSSVDAVIGSPLTAPATVAPLQSNNGNTSWNRILSQLDARRTSDGSSRYYYGVVNPPYASGVAGMGFVGHPVALGWDKLPSAASVAAHEWGHNWRRNHAPCGGASNPDAAYPYTGGTIGIIGYDLKAGVLKPSSSHDLMGYCNNEWISDYTYRGVMQYRSAEADVGGSLGAAIQPALVVWGRIENGEAILEPAFEAVTRPRLPTRDGSYDLEARSSDGTRVFSLRFTPLEIADDPGGGKHFAFAVPLTPERQARIAHLRLAGEGHSVTRFGGGGETVPVQLRRVGSGRLELRWDASRTPMVVVRDPGTGQILSFARGGRAEVVTDRSDLSLTASDGVRSRTRRVSVP